MKALKYAKPHTTLRVLSIDWDYFFQTKDDDRCRMFPDGGNENLPSVIQNTLWESHYASPNYNLAGVKVDLDEFHLATMLLASQPGYKDFLVANSHRELYDFIALNLNDKNRHYTQVEIVNIDYHHDVYNNALDEINCGNWLYHIMDNLSKYPNANNKYAWICRPDSDGGINYPLPDKLEVWQGGIGKHWKELSTTQFDLIFVCRSDVWSPPHLDPYFNMLVDELSVKQCPKCELDNRYTEDMISEIAEYKKQMSELMTNSNDMEV